MRSANKGHCRNAVAFFIDTRISLYGPWENGVINMPTYDYFCDANGEKVEVFHPMSESITNWGELCSKANRPLGETGEDEPVRKLISGAAVISSGSRAEPEPSCPAGGCCQGGSCGLDF